MNYLAHVFLSGDNEDLLTGNFIADAVKGKAIDKFSHEIKRGIILHRHIDEFTDHHRTQKKSRSRLWQRYRHYSGVLVDIYYDHFLAKNWSEYSSVAFLDYTHWVYSVLEKHDEVLPKRISYMLKYMIPQNWLFGYAGLDGINRVLQGMSQRTKFNSHMEHGVEDLEKHYDEFEAEFVQFFPELQDFVDRKLLVI